MDLADALWTLFAVLTLLVVLMAIFRRRRHIPPLPPAPPMPADHRISVLVPFSSSDARRHKTQLWLESYYRDHLPAGTEFIVAGDDHTPFRKTCAVNNAFHHASGDIIVILDADCYMDASDITVAANNIRVARSHKERLWYVPYRRFYRLTEAASNAVLRSNPSHPLFYGDPPPIADYEKQTQNQTSVGHWWGALVQIMPREAFLAAGGMDERFAGWGGEDISFMHAVDTLYGPHKTLNTAVFHLWHTVLPGRWKGTRAWEGQDELEANDWLTGKYESARGDFETMKRLVSGL